jgi:hypothetical protein
VVPFFTKGAKSEAVTPYLVSIRSLAYTTHLLRDALCISRRYAQSPRVLLDHRAGVRGKGWSRFPPVLVSDEMGPCSPTDYTGMGPCSPTDYTGPSYSRKSGDRNHLHSLWRFLLCSNLLNSMQQG